VFRAGFQRDFHHLFLGGAGSEQELAAVLEHEGDRAFLAQVAAVLGKGVAHFGHGAGAVVGHAVHDDGSSADTVAYIAHFVVVVAVSAARAAGDRALNGVLGHVGVSAFVPGHAQTGVGVGIGAAGAGGHRDFTNDFGPQLAALGVLAPFAVLNIGPFTVSG